MTCRTVLGLAILLAAISIGAHPADAGFRICNTASFNLNVAVVYHDQPRGWTSQGWWQVEGGQCKDLLQGDLKAGYYYYYGHYKKYYGERKSE